MAAMTADPAKTEVGGGARGGGILHRREVIFCPIIPSVGSECEPIAAFITILVGLTLLQKKANSLDLPAATQLVYTDTFQSGGQVPYPGQGSDQFALQWWLLFFELVIFLVITSLLLAPRLLHRFRAALLVFLGYLFTLVTLQVQSLLYFKRNAAANLVYGHHRIVVTLAGVLLLVVANAFSIIFLGLLHEDYAHPALVGSRGGADTVDGGKHRAVAQEPAGANVV